MSRLLKLDIDEIFDTKRAVYEYEKDKQEVGRPPDNGLLPIAPSDDIGTGIEPFYGHHQHNGCSSYYPQMVAHAEALLLGVHAYAIKQVEVGVAHIAHRRKAEEEQ